MIVAIILAAGESRRMGQPKALLPIDGTTFIGKIVKVLQNAAIARTMVVLGHNAKEMQNHVRHLPVDIVINEGYKMGQLSSLTVAIREIQASSYADKVDGVLVHLVDHPYLNADLIKVMIEKFYATKKRIVVPRYHGRRGHPVLFSRSLFGELLAAPLEQGAKSVVHGHREETLEVDTEEEGITIDIDTPDSYKKYVPGD